MLALGAERRDGPDDGLVEHERPGADLPLELPPRAARVELGVVLSERRGVGRTVLCLRRAAIAVEDALERGRDELPAQRAKRREQSVERRFGRHRTRCLGEDRAGVEPLVHQVHGHSELGVPLAHRPGERVRPAMARKERRVRVHDAEAGDREDLGRQEPGVSRAEPEVGLVRACQPLEARLALDEAEVETIGRLGEDLVAPIRCLRVADSARRQHRHRLDTQRACRGDEVLDRRHDARVENRAHHVLPG